MSYVTTNPEALEFAAGKLEGIGTALAAQNAASAASTATVAPAAADEVSALQATQFSAYGNLYQQVSEQATAIHQAFVQMLGTSAGSYGVTEAANSAATGAADPGGFDLFGQLTQFGQFGFVPGLLTNTGLGVIAGGQNFGAAASDFIPLANQSSGGGTTLVGDPAPPAPTPAVGAAAAPTAPVLASMSQSPTVGGLSVPPSWAGGGAPPSTTPLKLTGAGWTAPAPHTPQVSTVPGGVPSVATGGRTSGLGAPRYGIKPRVMPRPTVV
ncbi:PE domain-containing protein [Candidatus Mycobacterium wuenschmannii]|uniref:PE domain-containing protein n=1 Tax=Candidatus Mycobacterium wuenschmannii TaxID=3027808 RepID=A0ABY8W224_9MYCO|nr:PE domain-containing protein [Candidatus Mycobacterium wuenschmannii]WIM89915.1 PE domain-containing protein [Candidatus Mycobacterium wuenschmannii]